MIKAGSLILILLVIFSLACSGKRVEEGQSDKALYNAALEELDKKGSFLRVFGGTDYERVLKLLKEIQLRYTYSPYATLAEVRTADTYFKRGEYEQASIEYEEFMKRHPGHEEIPYTTYRLALSHYKQMRSHDRDPISTREALKWFTLYIEKHPDSPNVDKSKKIILKCRNKLARREVNIGKFYKKRENYKAAAERFRIVVNDYADTKAYEEASRLLSEVEEKEKKENEKDKGDEKASK